MGKSKIEFEKRDVPKFFLIPPNIISSDR